MRHPENKFFQEGHVTLITKKRKQVSIKNHERKESEFLHDVETFVHCFIKTDSGNWNFGGNSGTAGVILESCVRVEK